MKTINTLVLGIALMAMVQPVTARDHRHYQSPWAEYYARTTMAQVSEVHKLGCYHHGDRWSYDYYKHLRWASRHSQNKAKYEIQRRNQRLQACYNSQHHYAGNRGNRGYPRPHYNQHGLDYWQSRYSLSYTQPYKGDGRLDLGLVLKH